MLTSQIGFSQAIQEIYKPISGRPSDPDSIKSEGNVEGIQACEDYEVIMVELQSTLAPELEIIEQRIIKPADELMEIIKLIRKTATKREHKKLDYDRHRATLKKLQEKKEKTMKDEKALYKAENDVELATQEFNYYNDLLKEDLPKLFALEREFIRPLFQSFYYMQLNVFYTLHEKMQSMNIHYFDLSMDIEEGFQAKRGDVQEQAEAIPIVHFKTTGNKALHQKYKERMMRGKGKEAEAEKEANASSSGYGEAPPPTYENAKKDKPFQPFIPLNSRPPVRASSTATTNSTTHSASPPPYSNGPSTPVTNGTSNLALAAAAKKKKPAPPPPKPKPKNLTSNVERATALYDFEAQAEGDLSFKTGDVIEIVQR